MELESIGLLVVLLASSLLNAGYFVPIFLKAFFPKNGAAKGLKYAEASKFMVVPLFITATLSIVVGFYPDLFLKLIEVVK
jgi:multicomponent Na+:H+ antiporter subunit D